MASRLGTLIGAARRLPLPVVAARVAGRAGLRADWLDRADFLYSPDTQRPTKAIDILFGAMAEAGIDRSDVMESISGGVLLEIGCGRHAGFAPLAAVLGARRYIGADPGLNSGLLAHPSIRKAYLEPAMRAAADFAGLGEPAVTAEQLLDLCRLENAGVADALRPSDRIDVCVSISCLEHIRDFQEAARKIASASHADTVHVHLVNFSNHLSKAQPFGQLYEMSKADFLRKWDYTINGLRLPDILAAFTDARLPLIAIPRDVVPEALPERLHSSWAEAYDRETLAVRTALLVSPSISTARVWHAGS